ncbi:hypothetical protein [Amycolatopsis sp. CA-230715]|uniref:hypothetical protein n=1 Tax=Amycolatopsis sp. CA-230715 TaxID=2745196 RepID=UPI001C0196FC|nr:hypothetical protein [Amycolatopsis sp. CA-230715]QWF85923.1 hypothetical protein HUW46_09403 [Amycolatopsis sp. CA-230715]
MSAEVTTAGDDTTDGIATHGQRARPLPGRGIRARVRRVAVLGLLAAVLVPLLTTIFTSSAVADEDSDSSDKKKERENYSLYQLASNASTYFSEANSPKGETDPADRMTEDWRTVTSRPPSGGDMLGYADPEFSLGNVVGWLFAEISGSSQTISYDTLKATDGGKGTDIYAGMVDYAHFGATNADLGLDSMSSGIGGEIAGMISGSLIWLLYALALAVSMSFYLIIQMLKLVNPFSWFYQAVTSINGTFGDGMVCATDSAGAETCHKGGGALAGLQNWISDWYGVLNSLAWQALVPIFLALTVVGLIMFKKMDRGSAIKKLVVRVLYIGLGLPLVGSLYTGVLDKFDDSLLGQHAGPTRVVLSTYVDFNAWAMNDRLGIPDAAQISWDNGQASTNSIMSARTSALAINKQAHGDTYASINVGAKATDAQTAWRNGTTGVNRSASDDAKAVLATFGIINGYITSDAVMASDYESGIKSAITKLDVDKDDKKAWFVGKDGGYGDADKFGENADVHPTEHPVLSIGGKGLTSSNPGGNQTTYTTQGTKSGCGLTVMKDNAPAECNLSPQSMYNYLNTGFGPSSMELYSSNNATSGFTRENHTAVSQVGTGPAKFMYWSNAATVLGCIALLGFWYSIGMLAGAVKRTFGLVAAIPFAALGALSAISKVIVYSAALILEVLVTLFLYQFVSEFLVTTPDVIAGPIAKMMAPDGLFGSEILGGIVVVILTLISSLLILGVTIGLLKVRKVVLQAMDETVTKLVDKFLDTNNAPQPGKGGVLPALAAGAGAGAGMAMGNKLASGLSGKLGGTAASPSATAAGADVPTSTNAGGTNGDQTALASGPRTLALDSGSGLTLDSGRAPGGGPGGPGGGRPGIGPGRGEVTGLPAGANPDGGRLQIGSGGAGDSRADKETTQNLVSGGGLSQLGYDVGSPESTTRGRPPIAGGTSAGPGDEDSSAPKPHTPARFSVSPAGTTTDNPPQSTTQSGSTPAASAASNVSPALGMVKRPLPSPGRPAGLADKRPLGVPRDISRAPSAPRPVQTRPWTGTSALPSQPAAPVTNSAPPHTTDKPDPEPNPVTAPRPIQTRPWTTTRKPEE